MANDIQHSLFTLTAVFESLEDAVLTHDYEHIILQWNPAAETVFGYKAEEIIGKSVFTLIPEAYHPQQEQLSEDVWSGHRIAHQRTVRLARDGREFPVSLRISPIKDQDGKIIGASHILRNVTAESESEKSRAFLAAIIDSSEDAIISKSMEGIITSWNVGAEKIFGYTAEQAIGKPITMLIPKDRIAEEDYILSNIRGGNRVEHFQTIRLTSEGKEIPISLTVSPIKDRYGNIIGVSKIARNISGEKLAAERQAMLAAIVESSDDAIISKSINGMILSWNRGAEKIFGYTEAEVIGKHISILLPDHRLDEETDIISRIKKGERVDHFQTTRLAKNGREVYISLTVSPITDLSGKVIGASKVARDVTAFRESMDTLQRNNQKLNILNDVGKTIYQDLDSKAILQKVTDATTQITGADFGAFFYNTVNDHGESFMLYTLSGAPREKFDHFGMPRNTAVFHTTFSGDGVVRVDDITKDPRYGKNAPHFGMPEGHLPVVSYLAVPVKSADGNVIGGLFFGHKQAGMFQQEHEDLIVNLASQAAIALDNSKLFEEVKELSKKKDEFIALASHELKTPMTSLSGFLQMIERTVTEPVPKKFAGKSMAILEKLNTLITDLFDIAKIQSGKLQFRFEKMDVVALVSEVVETFRISHQSHQINFSGPESCHINGDGLRLEQAIVNLLNNAVKYSPGAEKIDVTVKNNSEAVIVIIQDYGIGISEENLAQIFGQFFRVDGISHKISGLGLGLFITKEIIERHKGQIMVESEVGKGSAFRIELPVEN